MTKGRQNRNHHGKKRKKKTEHDSSTGGSSNETNDQKPVKPASKVLPQREKWTEGAAYVRGYWDINKIEGDAALESLITNNYFIGCKSFRPLPWATPGSAACQNEVECLSEMCRDSELYAKGVAPVVPLYYLEKLAHHSPASFARSAIRNMILVLNGEETRYSSGIYGLVYTVLSALGEPAFDDLGAYLRDTKRPDGARCYAIRAIEAACLRSAYGPVWRHGGFVLSAVLASDCRENSVHMNTELVTTIGELRYFEGLGAIKVAIEAGRVTPPVAREYGEFLQKVKLPLPPQPFPPLQQQQQQQQQAPGLGDRLVPMLEVGASSRCPHCGDPLSVCSRKLMMAANGMYKEGVMALGVGRREAACRVAINGLAWLSPEMQDRALELYSEALLLLGRYEEAASANSESCSKLERLLYDPVIVSEGMRTNGRLACALFLLASATRIVAAKPNGIKYLKISEEYLKYLLDKEGREDEEEEEEDYEGEEGEYEEVENDDDNDNITNNGNSSDDTITNNDNDEDNIKDILIFKNMENKAHEVVIADWDHPIVFPALPLQVSTAGASSSLTVGKKCFAVISSQHKVEVGQFNDPLSYYSKVSASSSSSSSSLIMSLFTSKESKRPFSPLRSIKSLGVEGCRALSADPGGAAVAAIVGGEAQTVTVWELKADYSREVPLGPALRPPERVVCGGQDGGIVAASSQGTVTVWNWTEPEGSPGRGPFYLAATRGRVTAMAVDETARTRPTDRPSSLFAAVREPKRTCVLEYDLRTQKLERTLLGVTKILHCTDPAPAPNLLPTIATVACCKSHVAASTLCGSLHVWKRVNGPGEPFVRHVYRIKSLLDGGGDPSPAAGSNGRPSAGCAVSLAFIPGVLLCGLQCGQVVGYEVCSSQREQPPLFRIKGPSLPVSSISPLIQGSELLVRFASSGCLISTFLFNLREKGSDFAVAAAREGESPPKCSACQKVLSPKAPLLKCGGCMKTVYCSAECQKSDWKKHSQICK